LVWERDNSRALLPRRLAVLGPPVLDCRDLKEVHARVNEIYRRIEIYLVFNVNGAKKMERISKKNIGRKLAIVWRERVITVPRIRTSIPLGRAVISGAFRQGEAAEIIRVIRGCLTR